MKDLKDTFILNIRSVLEINTVILTTFWFCFLINHKSLDSGKGGLSLSLHLCLCLCLSLSLSLFLSLQEMSDSL